MNKKNKGKFKDEYYIVQIMFKIVLHKQTKPILNLSSPYNVQRMNEFYESMIIMKIKEEFQSNQMQNIRLQNITLNSLRNGHICYLQDYSDIISVDN